MNDNCNAERHADTDEDTAKLILGAAALPGIVNLLSFLFFGALIHENTRSGAILSDVDALYLFFGLNVLAVWEANGGMIP